MQPIKFYTENNRAAWNEVMPKHQAAVKDDLDRRFAQPGYIHQAEPELLRAFDTIQIQGKDILHLCCNNGRELLSLKNMGAGRCVGVDISDAAIAEANERAQKCGIACEFIRADVYELPGDLANSFDVVHLTAGCLGWIPDLKGFFRVLAATLRNNGVVLIHEIHPFSEMLPFDSRQTEERLQIIEPYFRDAPIVENSSLDYVGGTDYEAKPQYWFVHTVSAVLMAMFGSGLTLEEFSEHPRDISAGHQKQEALNAGVPLSMLLIGKKTGRGGDRIIYEDEIRP